MIVELLKLALLGGVVIGAVAALMPERAPLSLRLKAFRFGFLVGLVNSSLLLLLLIVIKAVKG